MPAMEYDRVAHLYDAYVQFTFGRPFFEEEAKNGPGIGAGADVRSLPGRSG